MPTDNASTRDMAVNYLQGKGYPLTNNNINRTVEYLNAARKSGGATAFTHKYGGLSGVLEKGGSKETVPAPRAKPAEREPPIKQTELSAPRATEQPSSRTSQRTARPYKGEPPARRPDRETPAPTGGQTAAAATATDKNVARTPGGPQERMPAQGILGKGIDLHDVIGGVGGDLPDIRDVIARPGGAVGNIAEEMYTSSGIKSLVDAIMGGGQSATATVGAPTAPTVAATPTPTVPAPVIPGVGPQTSVTAADVPMPPPARPTAPEALAAPEPGTASMQMPGGNPLQALISAIMNNTSVGPLDTEALSRAMGGTWGTPLRDAVVGSVSNAQPQNVVNPDMRDALSQVLQWLQNNVKVGPLQPQNIITR